MPRIFSAAARLLSAAGLLFVSCDRPQPRVYVAPKDAPPPPAADADQPPPQHEAPKAKPTITFTLPAGWSEVAPGDVSIAAFAIKADGAEASVNVTPLPDLRGRESLVVNMYRQQTGQQPIEQADLDKTLAPVEAAGGPGQLLELVGANRGKPVRLITVIAHRDGRSWFYRLSGDEAFVTTVKPAFLDFIKSVKITEPAPEPAPAHP
jgi:hypothetical protein